MYPVKSSENRIKITILDLIDDLFEFVLVCVRSLRNPKSLSCFLDKSLHI